MAVGKLFLGFLILEAFYELSISLVGLTGFINPHYPYLVSPVVFLTLLIVAVILDGCGWIGLFFISRNMKQDGTVHVTGYMFSHLLARFVTNLLLMVYYIVFDVNNGNAVPVFSVTSVSGGVVYISYYTASGIVFLATLLNSFGTLHLFKHKQMVTEIWMKRKINSKSKTMFS